MAKKRFILLASLSLLAVLAPLAQGQESTRPAKRPQIHMTTLVARLSISGDEEKVILQEFGVKKENRIRTGMIGSLVWTLNNTERTWWPLLQRMRYRSTASLLAMPNLVTLPDRPAMYLFNNPSPLSEQAKGTNPEIQLVKYIPLAKPGQMPPESLQQEIGQAGSTECKLLPSVTAQGSIRLQADFTHNELVQEASHPLFKASRFKATAEVHEGGAMLFLVPITGSVKEESTRAATHLLVVVRPTLVTP